MLARSNEPRTSLVAKAYDLSGATYGSYADGDTSDLFRFSGMHGYADYSVWASIMAKLSETACLERLRSTFSTPDAVPAPG
jgi:hypothetical protein